MTARRAARSRRTGAAGRAHTRSHRRASREVAVSHRTVFSTTISFVYRQKRSFRRTSGTKKSVPSTRAALLHRAECYLQKSQRRACYLRHKWRSTATIHTRSARGERGSSSGAARAGKPRACRGNVECARACACHRKSFSCS